MQMIDEQNVNEHSKTEKGSMSQKNKQNKIKSNKKPELSCYSVEIFVVYIK